MINDFNILATTFRRMEFAACSELNHLLQQIGDANPSVAKTGITGLIAAKTVFNPCEVIQKLRHILHDRPYEFRYTLRIIPVEKIVHTDLGEIQSAAVELSSKIGKYETFRVTVEKRFTSVHAQEIIEATAANIRRKVDLSKPNKILLIEVVGELTGLSVIKPDGILCVMKEKVL